MRLEGINEIAKRERKTKEPREKIFDRYKARTLRDLDTSIKEARGRFQGEGAGPVSEVYASRNWKVHHANDKKPGQDEQVDISIKAGSARVRCLVNSKGETVNFLRIPSTDVVNALLQLKRNTKAFKGNEEDGVIFHGVAKKQAKPKLKKSEMHRVSFDEKKDDWVVTH